MSIPIDVEWLVIEFVFSFILVIPALRLCVRLGLPQGLASVIFVPCIGLPWFLLMIARRPWPLFAENISGGDD